MSAQKNRFGLSRTISAEIKRSVRQACGFGCVICGSSIIDYEHVDPEFSEATEHCAKCIALLCPTCHGYVTRGVWSKQKVKEALASPKCRQTGFSFGSWDFGMNHPSIQFGGLTLRSCIVPVLVRQTPLFAIQRPEVEGGPFRLSANFCNSNGNLILQIQDNEWQASSDSWDVEFSGGAITIRERRGQQCLRLKADPPYGLVVERLDMLLLGKRFIGSPTQLEVIASNSKMTFTGSIADECVVGLAL